MTFEKTISPSYETIGRRARLAGYIGQIIDESGLVLHSQEYSTNSQAETALNAIVYDLLSDYCERGLVDTVPACDGPAAAPGGILVMQVALDPPAEPCPLGDDEGDTMPSYCATCGNDGDCPDCQPDRYCGTCHGEGRIPAYGTGDQAGGYAETCPDCDGRPREVSSDELPPYTSMAYQMSTPLLADVHAVLSRLLDNAALVGIVPEIERVLHRVEQALVVEQIMTA